VGLLSQFLQYYSAKKPRLNLTKINLVGKQDRHCVGRKPNQPRERFKGPMAQSEVVIECRKVFADNRPSVGNQGASLSPEVENHALSQAQVQFSGYEAVSSEIPSCRKQHIAPSR